MNKKATIIIVVLVLLVIIGVIIYKNNDNDSSMQNEMMNSQTTSTTTPGTDTTATTSAAAVNAAVTVNDGTTKNFTVTGTNFAFAPKTLSVKKGDTVTITFVNSNGFHDLHIDEFNAKTKVIKAGEQEAITFVADKTGSFQYYCAVGKHRAMGMWGTLTVTE